MTDVNTNNNNETSVPVNTVVTQEGNVVVIKSDGSTQTIEVPKGPADAEKVHSSFLRQDGSVVVVYRDGNTQII